MWIRISEMGFPNWMQNAAIVAAAPQRHSGPAMSRWQVPVDDEHSIAFGWRHFNDEVDPEHNGREEECGVDKDRLPHRPDKAPSLRADAAGARRLRGDREAGAVTFMLWSIPATRMWACICADRC